MTPIVPNRGRVPLPILDEIGTGAAQWHHRSIAMSRPAAIPSMWYALHDFRVYETSTLLLGGAPVAVMQRADPRLPGYAESVRVMVEQACDPVVVVTLFRRIAGVEHGRLIVLYRGNEHVTEFPLDGSAITTPDPMGLTNEVTCKVRNVWRELGEPPFRWTL